MFHKVLSFNVVVIHPLVNRILLTAAMVALPIVITILAVWFVSHVWTFLGNYRVARASGLPYVICPINPDNVRLYLQVASLVLACLHEDPLYACKGPSKTCISNAFAKSLLQPSQNHHTGLGVYR